MKHNRVAEKEGNKRVFRAVIVFGILISMAIIYLLYSNLIKFIFLLWK
jgi:hypothetical protein